MSKKITLVGRLSFPSLFQPRAMEGAQPKYEATVLMEPASPCIKSFMQEALEVLMSGKLSLSEADARQLLKAKPPIKDGNQKQAQGYAGNYYITCRSTQQPDFYGPDKKRLDIEAAKKLFYAGCKVAVITTPWAYAKQGNRGVSADLLAVMFLGHGDAFSGRPVVDASDLPDVDPADLDPGGFTAGAPVRATEPDPTDNWI